MMDFVAAYNYAATPTGAAFRMYGLVVTDARMAYRGLLSPVTPGIW
jgi:hypothetical protein